MKEAAPAFDFVIVGAGSAGCVLADRLSADGRNTVLLIEAGGREWNPLYRLPMMAGRLYRFRMNNWWYHSVPQAGMNGREIFLPRGKMVGGSFVFNGMQYVRGHPVDYDQWAQMGNRGWSFDEVLPYFKRSESFDRGPDTFHGSNGPLPVTRAPEANVLSHAFVQASVQAGFPANSDFNGATQDGFGFFDFNVRNGRRWTTAHSFLYPAMRRSNLCVVTDAMVSRVMLRNGEAEGVELRRGGTNWRFIARREVVICSGAINTPKLLLLSGVGDADALGEHGIPVQHHSPGVGRNFQDHVNVGVGYKSREAVSVVGTLRADRLLKETMRAWATRKGPVARSVLEAGGFFRSRPGLAAPDCQVVFTPIFGPAARVWAPWSQSLDDHSFGAVIWPIRPESRGAVRLRSADADADPIIDPRFLSSANDIATTCTGLRTLRRIFQQPAMDRYRGEEIKPGAATMDDAELAAYARETGGSGHHACGTAKMGQDPLAVVDDRLRVHGVRKVRIADASIMPTMPSGNTNAPVIMVAEKAADFILHNH